jgi:pimeloyl-ACP methyl ester carboxylesterase
MVSTLEKALPVWRDQTASVQVAGQGSPLVFLHGENGLRWDGFLDGLAGGHTVYAPRHPGTTPGDPEAIRSVDNLWDLVLYYADMLEGLGLERAHLVGHGFGGMVAAELAACYPASIDRLVLINPLGLWRDDAPVANQFGMKPDALLRATFSRPDGPAAQAWLQAQTPAGDPESIANATWALACTGRFIWPIPDKGLKKRIHRIKAPTLLVWGADNGIVPPVYAQEFASRIAGSRVEIIADAAHLPQVEQPARTLEAIERFLGA